MLVPVAHILRQVRKMTLFDISKEYHIFYRYIAIDASIVIFALPSNLTTFLDFRHIQSWRILRRHRNCFWLLWNSFRIVWN